MKQYYHQKHLFPRSTVSVEIPLQLQLLNLLPRSADKLLMLFVGVAFVHPKDRFIKSEGRKVADAKIEPKTFRLKSTEYDSLDNLIIKMVTISPEEDRIKELTFKVFSSTNRVYLIGARVL